MTVRSYKDLQVWQESKKLVKEVYALTVYFPKEEIYGLTSQIKRSVVSIPSNIAEGHARAGTKEFLRFISIAFGSIAELETQLDLAVDLGFIESIQCNAVMHRLDIIGKMLRRLSDALKLKLELPTPSLKPPVPA